MPRSSRSAPRAPAPDPRFVEQPSLFGDESPPPQQPSKQPPLGAAAANTPQPNPATSLLVQAPGQRQRSAAGQAFERERARIERLRQQLQTLEADGQAHRTRCAQLLGPLQQQQKQLRRAMVLALDPWLEGKPKGLSANQLDTLRQIVCAQSESLALEGEADMAALHDRRSPQTLAERQLEQAKAIHQDLQQGLGDALETELPEFDPDNPSAALHAALEHLQQQFKQQRDEQEQLAQQKAAKRAAKQARRKPSAAAEMAAAHLADADATLRLLYRQLASALHPDRAADAADQAHKHTLMSAVNAAYANRDLVALLELQWRAELVDPDHLERVGDERLRSLTLLLKQQAAALERDRQACQWRLAEEFDLLPHEVCNLASLRRALQDNLDDLQDELELMQHDLEQVQALATLKPWLTEQRRLLRAAEREQQQRRAFASLDDLDPWG